MESSHLRARAAIALNAGLFLTLALSWGLMAWRGDDWRADFTGYYTGWRMVLDGRGADLYDLGLQAEYQNRIAPPLAESPDNQLPFNYPPHLAVLAPLGLLPRPAAYFTWFVVQLGMLAWALRMLLAIGQPPTAEARALWVATALAFPPLMVTLTQGQLSLLALLCQAGMVLSLLKGQRWQAAGWFVLGTVKPSLMVIPGVILLAAGQWGVALRAGVLFAPWAAMTTAVLGPGRWADFLHALRHTASQAGLYGVYPEQMTNFKAVLVAGLGPDRLGLANAVNAGAFALVCLATVALWRGRWKGGPDGLLRLSLALQLGTLFNPHQYRHDTLTLALPAALLWAGLGESRLRGWVGGLLVGAPLLFLVSNEVRLAVMIGLVILTGVALAEARSGRHSLGADSGR